MMRNSQSPFIYRDASWLVVYKPCGLSSHAAHSGDLGLAEWLDLHHDLPVHLCSRLDKETSGLMLLALDGQASSRAQAIHEQQQASKVYYFVTDKKGAVSSSWTCNDPLDGKPCSTSFQHIESGHGSHLYRAKISRGRKHQIRRHAAAAGVAILGDSLYGGTSFPRLCLHCAELHWPELPEPLITGLPLSFSHLLAGIDRLQVGVTVACERRLPLLSSITNAMRLVHRGEVEGRPFSIDLFDRFLCVSGYDENLSSESLRTTLAPALEILSQELDCLGGVIRTNRRDPHRRKLFSDIISWGEEAPDTFWVHEHDLRFQVALNSSQHVGLFLDQRDSRRRIWQKARGKRLANLFAFTCSFSVFAVQAGAEVVFSVDLAAGSLGRGKANLEANSLDQEGRGKFIKEDVRKWLARQLRKKEADPKNYGHWDMMICDPPVFASAGKGATFAVEKEWHELGRQVSALLVPGGLALFANNHSAGNSKKYLAELQDVFRKVTPLKPPFDFPDIAGEPQHVRIFWCEV
ncbi:MAG: class I SAM-dependent methyltransferase [Thermodesulfobacteriota bacterium]